MKLSSKFYAISVSSSLFLGVLLEPAVSLPILGLGGVRATPTPSASPTSSLTQSPTPNPTSSPSPSATASTSPSTSISPTQSASPSSTPTPRLLLQPVAPLDSSRLVTVPEKYSNLPPILLRVPENWKLSDVNKNISERSWCRAPKEVLVNVFIGGDCNLIKVPMAFVSKARAAEVQTLIFVPTRVRLQNLPKNATFSIILKTSKTRSRNIGYATSDALGQFTLPPITLGSSKSYVLIELTWSNKRTYAFILRSIK